MGKPRVGLVTYGVERPLSGITRVTLELGRELQGQDECSIVYMTPYRRGPFRRKAGLRSVHLVGCSRLPALMLVGGLTIALAARTHRLDLVHDPAGIAPFPLRRRVAPFRRVVTIYDAIGYRYPAGYPWLNTFVQRRYLPALLDNVDAVITGSRHARADLEHFLPRLPAGEYVVPPAVSTRFQPVAEGDRHGVLERLGLHRPYVLSVGAQQERKNLRLLIRAFALFHARHPDHQLVVAGPTLWRFTSLRAQIAQAGLSRHVVLLGYVADDDLAALYSGAALLAFPSLYEGFGLPVLEAMACATPVVCSNTTALPETAGDAALLVDPTSVEEIAAGMERLVTDQEFVAGLRRRGQQRAATFSWRNAARQTVAVYQDVLGQR
jgi:glycosyltransferase involved in cell wall biosynthesis